MRLQIQEKMDTPHLTVCCSLANCGSKARVRLQIQGNTDTPRLTVVCPQGASAVTSDPVAGTLTSWTLNLIPPTLVEGLLIFPTESLDGYGRCMKITLQGCATDGQLLAGLHRYIYCRQWTFSLSLSLFLSLSPSLSVSVSLCLCLSLCPSVSVSLSLSVCLSLLCSGTICNHQPNLCAGHRPI